MNRVFQKEKALINSAQQMSATPQQKIELEQKVPTYLRIPESIISDLNADARDFGKSKDDVAALILYQHFLMKRQERKLLYRAIPNKRAGRPVKLKK